MSGGGEPACRRVELHCHSSASPDGHIGMKHLAAWAHRRKLHAIAVVDHDIVGVGPDTIARFAGTGLSVIPGTEVTLANGSHLIALYVETTIAAQTVTEFVDAVARQRGIICIPHPWRAGTGLLSVAGPDSLEAQVALRESSLIELWNAKDAVREDRLASTRELAARFGLHLVAGSDAHRPWEIGRCVVEVPADGTLREALVRGPVRIRRLRAPDPGPVRDAMNVARRNPLRRVAARLPQKAKWLVRECVCRLREPLELRRALPDNRHEYCDIQ